MNEQTFTHEGDGTYVRSGECNRCGECCKTGDPFEGEMGAPVIAGACPLLSLFMGRHVCTDRQNSYYLNGCNVFPTHPLQVADKPGCSYTFEKVS